MIKTSVLICLLMLMVSFIWAQNHQVHFTQMTGLDYDYDRNNLFKPTDTDWTNSMAVSTNEITTETTASVSYVVQGVYDVKAFGWAGGYNPTGDLRDLKLAFYIDNGDLFIAADGKILGRYGKIKQGTSLAITFRGNTANFYMNGRPLNRGISATRTGLRVAAVIYNEGGDFSGITSNVDHAYYLTSTLTDITASSPGQISIESKGKQTQPDEFYWGEEYMSEAEFDTQLTGLDDDLLDLLGPDPYDYVFSTNQTTQTSSNPKKLTVHYPEGSGFGSSTFSSSYALETTAINDMALSADGRTLVATSNSAEADYDAFFFTSEDQGWVDFTTGVRSYHVSVGLFDVDDTSADPMNKYGWLLKSTVGISYFDNGVGVPLNIDIEPNMNLSFEIEDGEIIYLIDGVQVAQVALDQTIEVLQLKVDFSEAKSYIKKLAHSKPPVTISGCKPNIVLNHFECDGSGQAKVKVSYKSKQVGNCGGPFDFYLTDPDLDFALHPPVTDVYSAELTAINGPGSYLINVQESGTIIYQELVDIGFKHDWEAIENCYTAELPNQSNNNVFWAGGGIAWPIGIAEGHSKLGIGQEGWIQWDVEDPLWFGRLVVNWSNNYENDDIISSSVMKYAYLDEFLARGVIDGQSQEQNFMFDKLDFIRIKRNETEYTVVIGYDNEEVILNENSSGNMTMTALRAFVSIKGLRLTNASSSYRCSDVSFSLYSEMERSLDGEMHVMTGNSIRFIYNEPYSVSEIKRLELIRSNEIIDLSNYIDLPEIKRGDNRIDLLLPSEILINEDEICTLKLMNQKNEVYYLKVRLL